jgi:rare lipoprotein A
MKRTAIPRCAVIAVTLWLLAIAGCGKKHRAARTQPAPQPSTPATAAPATAARQTPNAPARVAVPNGYTEQGVASWYGIPFNGRAAADGEIYDMETLVAAHRLMPFNTWLKVTNLSNNKSVNVRVIDRGPFVEGRIIDLSKAAARQIDLLGPGVGPVRLEVIGAPADIPANDFYAVQVGAFSVYANAERARIEYAQRFGTAQLAVRQGKIPMWRVLVGKEPSIQHAQQLANSLATENKDVFVVRLDETVLNGNANSKTAPPPLPAATNPATNPAPATPASDEPQAAPVPPR